MPSICHAFWAEDCKYEATSVFVFESVINIILFIHYLIISVLLVAVDPRRMLTIDTTWRSFW